MIIPDEKGTYKLSLLLNESACKILELIDCAHTISEVVQMLAEIYGEPAELIHPKVEPFINELITQGILVQAASSPLTGRLKVTGSREFLVPLHLAVELTYKCNLRCLHCYGNYGPKTGRFINVDLFQHVLREFYALGLISLELTGGEPTFHPNWRFFIEFALNEVGVLHVGLITNGTLILQQDIEFLRMYRDSFSVQVDLHGSNAEYVDYFTRGQGVFHRQVQLIKVLCDNGIRTRVVMCATPSSLNQVYEVAKIAKSFGATSFGVSPVIPMGRAITKKHALILNDSQLELLNNIIIELQNIYGKDFIYTVENILRPLQRFGNLFSESAVFDCGAGYRSLAIAPDGSIKICQMSPQYMKLGKLTLKSSIKKILEDLPLLKFANIRPPDAEVCGSCKNLTYCGGCKVRGYLKANASSWRCNWGSRNLEMIKPVMESGNKKNVHCN